MTVDRATFAELARVVARGAARVERELICCGDVTLQQFETLRALHAAGTLLTSSLAERLRIDLSTASRNLTVLEREGYIARVHVKKDGRAVGNRLTKKGERCVTSLCCDEREVFDAVLERIPPATRSSVVDALSVLAKALSEQCSSAADACAEPEGGAQRCAPSRRRA
jgi:DNA-binding MarR family transcriptional regulator